MSVDPLPPNDKYVGLHVVGYIISWCYFFINPFIWVLSNNFFKNAFMKTFPYLDSGCFKNQKENLTESHFGTLTKRDQEEMQSRAMLH